MKATETAFYLQKGREQTLPCVDKTPGDKSCSIRWMQEDKDSGRQILHYQVFNNHITAEPTFHLAVDFGLTIKSVQDNHTGRYTCSRGAGKPYTIISAFVIGDSFPLDDMKSIAADQVTFEPGQRFELPCPAKSNLSETTKATLVWSYGTSDKRSSTVIGTRNLPDGSKSMSDLGGKRCFDIASNGSLLSNCSDEDDVRYWCHVFPHDSLLRRSHVDVSFHTQNTTPNSAQVPCMRLHVAGVIIACEMMIRLVLSWNNLT
ncbi:uncharacterized protein LOC110975595 [Acanthaster planci]|uniref:Uncharacterized protein LOC110975595 n=1 Tax=Acanthaster planci TaxID=133434 RepID=A0A8B7XSN1_ACAPL|nr:uncharacterized protein LOC110975595 [Acanthaster planci]